MKDHSSGDFIGQEFQDQFLLNIRVGSWHKLTDLA